MEMIYKDKYVVVCRKAAGELAEGESSDSLPLLIRERLADSGEPETAIFPAHRLDRETEGVMVYARTKQAAAALSEHIREGRLEKIYLAVCHGCPEDNSDTLTDLLFYDRQRGKSFVADRKRNGVRSASLEYKVLGTADGISLLRIKLHTGRTHQIRVQLASRRHPLVGDRRYGAPKDGARGIALLSHQLTFPHPHSGELMTFTAQPTDIFPWTEFSYK